MKKRFGFTIIELMVVMAIIAILATAGLSSYAWYLARADDLKSKILVADLFALSLEFKSNHNGRSPTDAELKALKEEIATLTSPQEDTIALFSNSLFPQVFAQAPQALQHPSGSKPICVRDSDNKDIMCEIVYAVDSAGNIGVGATMRSTSAIEENSFHSVDITDGGNTRKTYGIFVGNMPYLSGPQLDIMDALEAYNATLPVEKRITVVFKSLTYTDPTPPSTDTPGVTDPPVVCSGYGSGWNQYGEWISYGCLDDLGYPDPNPPPPVTNPPVTS